MAISENGREYDIPFIAGSNMRTTVSQYYCVSLVAGTTTANRTVEACGDTGTYGTPTAAAFHCIGINQTYLSASAGECNVRLQGNSKAVCAESITAGQWVMPYFGVSTTTRKGQIVAVDNGVSAGGHSVTVHSMILGRALEAGSTNTVITVFINSQLYDWNLIGTIGIT
jgi:hypothetical protein